MSRYKTARSMTPDKAVAMLSTVKTFHTLVRTWIAEVPLRSPIYILLSILNTVLIMFLCELQGDADAIPRMNNDGGPR